MRDAAVELVRATKNYGAVKALTGVDLSINEGEVVAILGPNGAGKTTAISLMLGLRRPTSGEVRLFGLQPTDRRARSRCGVMLQESGVPRLLKVAEAVDLFGSYYASPIPVARALELAMLEDRAGRRIDELSGGERQRLYYALAICGDPELLFLDEPTVGMDVASRHTFLKNIREFAGSGVRTIVLTTHYIEEADELAERIVVIDHGHVIADAPPADIKARVPGHRVTFMADPTLTRADFSGLPLEWLDLSGTSVRFLSNHPEDVLIALIQRGIRPVNLEVVGADLEEAFLALTNPAGAAA
ncbi:MAG TPA: ABC transporter ATP-binding protein [Candidatus Dormibacteraeota bacterium]